MLKLTKIISNGEPGAPRGALEAARQLNIETGGCAQKGFLVKNISAANESVHKRVEAPDLKSFGLTEYNGVEPNDIKASCIENIQNSNGTLVIGPETFKTVLQESHNIKFHRTNCEQYGKPILINPSDPKELKTWVEQNQIGILNVNGGLTKHDPAIQEKVTRFIIDAFPELQIQMGNDTNNHKETEDVMLNKAADMILEYAKNTDHKYENPEREKVKLLRNPEDLKRYLIFLNNNGDLKSQCYLDMGVKEVVEYFVSNDVDTLMYKSTNKLPQSPKKEKAEAIIPDERTPIEKLSHEDLEEMVGILCRQMKATREVVEFAKNIDRYRQILMEKPNDAAMMFEARLNDGRLTEFLEPEDYHLVERLSAAGMNTELPETLIKEELVCDLGNEL
jgi:hypothetical protein